MHRIQYLDSLRALATVAVVAIHVATNNWYGYVGTADWITFTIYAGLCKFCVPAFFMISGVLFLSPKRNYSLKRLYSHNILRLVLFLLVWSSIYLVFHLLENGEPITAGSLLGCAKSILKGDTQTHFWFVYALIGIYIVAPIIKVFTDNADRRIIEYFLVLWLVIQSFFTAISQIPLIAPVFNNIDKMMVQITMSYLGFFVLGHYLDTYELRLNARKAIYALGIFGIVVSIVLTMLLSIHSNVPDESCFGYFFPGIVLYSTALFVFFKQRKARPQADGGGDSPKACRRHLEVLSWDLRRSHAVCVPPLGCRYNDFFVLWDLFGTRYNHRCLQCFPVCKLGVVQDSRPQQVHGLGHGGLYAAASGR